MGSRDAYVVVVVVVVVAAVASVARNKKKPLPLLRSVGGGGVDGGVDGGDGGGRQRRRSPALSLFPQAAVRACVCVRASLSLAVGWKETSKRIRSTPRAASPRTRGSKATSLYYHLVVV